MAFKNHLGSLVKMQVSTFYTPNSRFCCCRPESRNVHFLIQTQDKMLMQATHTLYFETNTIMPASTGRQKAFQTDHISLPRGKTQKSHEKSILKKDKKEGKVGKERKKSIIQKLKYKSMEQDRKPRIRPGTYSPLIKEVRLYNVGKTISSTNGAGKTGQPHVKK